MAAEHLDILHTDREEIAAYWRAIVQPGHVHEVRIPKTRKNGARRLFGVASGYYDDPTAFVSSLRSLTGLDAEGVYLSLNPTNPDLLARAHNRLQDGRPVTTTDADVLCRRHLLIDIDPIRPTGISATDDEREDALRVRDGLQEALASLGWPPALASVSTGNGGALVYRIALDNTPESTRLVERTLKGLAGTFTTDTVVIDTTTSNAARIAKVAGTVSAKGDSIPTRPWRLATAEYGIDALPVPVLLLEQVGGWLPEPAQTVYTTSGAPIDVADRLRSAGIGFRVADKGWATVYTLDRCLTSSDHQGDTASAIMAFPSGALEYRCLHQRCADKRWADVREQLGFVTREPGPRITIDGQDPAAWTGPPTVRPVMLPIVPGTPRGRRAGESRMEVAFDPSPVPAVAMYGWFRDYVELVEPTTEGSASFHLGAALVLAASSIGRRVFASYASDELYANLYVLLIPAGRAKKDTAIKRALKLPQLPGPNPEIIKPRPFSVTTDISSSEGLVAELKNAPNTMLYITEFAKLMGNAHRQSTGTIIPTLIHAFDTPPILQNKTKNNPLEAKAPYLSIISGVQPDILGQHMLSAEVASGYGNRWMYFVGDGTEGKPRPPALDRMAAWKLYADLLDNIERYPEGKELPFLEEGWERWDAWYMADFHRETSSDEEDTMRNRLAVMIQKVALIFAVSEHAPGIGDRHIEAAIALVEWMWANLRRLIRTWGEMPDAHLERRIIEVLTRKGPLAKRPLQQAVGHKMGPGVFAKVIEAMFKNETIGVTEDKRIALLEG